MQKKAVKKVPSISFPEGGAASDSKGLNAVLQIGCVCVFYFPIKSHLLPSLFTPAGDLMCQLLLIYITPMFGLVSLACLHVIQLIVLHMFTLSDLLQPDGAYM